MTLLKPLFNRSSALFLFTLFLGLWADAGFCTLSNDPNQHFDPTPTSGGNPKANWAITHSGATAYTLTALTTNSGGTADPSDITPATTGLITSSGSCPSCNVTLTYTDPDTLSGSAQQYVLVDVYTANTGRGFQIIATDVSNNSVTGTTNDLLYDCAGGGILGGSTVANTWSTLFADTSGLGTIKTVTIIVPSAGTMNTNPVYVDNLYGASNLPCLVPPTPTPTPTGTPTDTPTDTPTITDTWTVTPTSTITATPTKTSTSTPSDTASPTPTKTSTYTPSSTPTPTSPNTPTLTPTFTSTGTPTNTGAATSTNTPSFTATNTFTQTATPTLTLTLTPTFTFTHTLSPTFTFSPTITLTPTNTFTFTPTFSPTNTNTPGPTSTFTNTPCPITVYPQPMDFQHNPAYNNQCPGGNACIKIGCIPIGSSLKIYTVDLSLVRSYAPNDPNFIPNPSLGVGIFTWDGKNGDGNPVSSGFYYFVVDGPSGRSFGKLAISRSWTGP